MYMPKNSLSMPSSCWFPPGLGHIWRAVGCVFCQSLCWDVVRRCFNIIKVCVVSRMDKASGSGDIAGGFVNEGVG